MMSFHNLDLNIHYDSGSSDILNEFYIPALSESIEYYRAVGYFNSKSLSIASRGVKNFILNKGKMKLLCGVEITPEDAKAIQLGIEDPESIITSNFFKDLENIENEIVKNHVQILGWMIAHEYLEIKIAVNLDSEDLIKNDDGIIHYKVGIMKDKNRNYLAFSGSNNETSAGWSKNLEQFNLFRSWIDKESKYLQKNIKLFMNSWNGEDKSFSVLSVPEAIKKKLIDLSPKNFEDLKFHNDLDLNKKKDTYSNKKELRDYQKKAIKKWQDNNEKGIFAMATGTGKTYTALGALKKILDRDSKLITIISSPSQHLVHQWKDSIEDMGIDKLVDEIIIVDSGNTNGKKQLKNTLLDIYNGYVDNLIVLTTHDSLYRPNFISIIKNVGLKTPYFLIADEMHGLGSYSRKKGLLSDYKYRLGLSATPERYFDEIGTKFLLEYFGDVVYEFSLEEAIKKSFLTPYNYKPYFLNLTSDELEKYKKITKNLTIELNKKDSNQKNIESLLFKRAKVIKNAENKFSVLEKILDDIGENIQGTIIYCSDKQIDKVLNILGNRKNNISARKFTMEESAKPMKKWGNKSLRDIILDDFAKGNYSVLVAMKCLDEGVDVPSASKAILLCNSNNSREFIQRIGRVIRTDENKIEANIYDLIIKPSQNKNEFTDIEEDIYKREMHRCEEIAKLAINNTKAFIKLYK